ncbi:hypothetical protein B0F90DRAFT_876468 [Multifurca ochricompacta]|uniref:Uncharacterized protein n=1 Tax=Multifurca ochricompacta TaxID=376703 RepID=A0AAD4LU38_9AGAM|nr:hypothetical protein B0F90DRAFT_876468 [Multifurca ochricompacta]
MTPQSDLICTAIIRGTPHMINGPRTIGRRRKMIDLCKFRHPIRHRLDFLFQRAGSSKKENIRKKKKTKNEQCGGFFTLFSLVRASHQAGTFVKNSRSGWATHRLDPALTWIFVCLPRTQNVIPWSPLKGNGQRTDNGETVAKSGVNSLSPPTHTDSISNAHSKWVCCPDTTRLPRRNNERKGSGMLLPKS